MERRNQIVEAGMERRVSRRLLLRLSAMALGGLAVAACAPAAPSAPTSAPAPAATAAPAAKPTAPPAAAATSAPAAATSTAAAPAQAKPTRPIKIAATQTGLSGLLVRTAKDFGFIDKAGVPIDVAYMDGGATEDAFATGAVDVQFPDIITAAKDRSKGIPAALVSPLINTFFHILVKKDSPYQDVLSLKGTKHGQFGQGSSATIFLKVLMKTGYNEDYESMFEQVVAPPATLPQLLDKGDVQSIVLFPPATVTLLASGNYRSVYGPFSDVWKKQSGYPLTLSFLAVRDDTITTFGKGGVKQLLGAFQSAIDFMKTDTDKVLDRYEDITSANTPALKAALKKEMLDGPYFQAGLDDKYVESQMKLLQTAKDLKLVDDIPAGLFVNVG